MQIVLYRSLHSGLLSSINLIFQARSYFWIPAFAGMTLCNPLHRRQIVQVLVCRMNHKYLRRIQNGNWWLSLLSVVSGLRSIKVDSLQLGERVSNRYPALVLPGLRGFIRYYLAHKETRELAESLLRLDQ
ncbi:MAG: hypothetical protein ACLQBD_04455 [Syntrophobacteraceae bacterium]